MLALTLSLASRVQRNFVLACVPLLLYSSGGSGQTVPKIIDIDGNVRFEYVVNSKGGDEYQIYVTGVPTDARKSCHLFKATATSMTDHSQYTNGKLEGIAALIIPGTAFPVTLKLIDVRVAFFDAWYKNNQTKGVRGTSYGNPCIEMSNGKALRPTGPIMYSTGLPCDSIVVSSTASSARNDIAQYLMITRDEARVTAVQAATQSVQIVSTHRADIDPGSFHVDQVNGAWKLTFQTTSASLFAVDSSGRPPYRNNSIHDVELACLDNGDIGHVIELLRNREQP